MYLSHLRRLMQYKEKEANRHEYTWLNLFSEAGLGR